jgi:glycosyltransferase involved in cell wall biosynthesis
MNNQAQNRPTASCEAEARSKLKSQFELFAQPLPTEDEMFAMWGDSDEVVASIACATFEHGALLDDAIRSFLMQKTDFRFEIVIRDDASTDGTRDLIDWYMQSYPNIIRAKIYDENQYKLGRMPGNDWISLTSGKYIALCEGEDLWIDSEKLQRQVSQLKRINNSAISVAGTLHYDVINCTSKIVGLMEDEQIHTKITPKYHHTSTFVVVREAYEAANERRRKYNLYGDMALRRLLVDEGVCVCLPRLVSVYWINHKGVWSSLCNERKLKERVILLSKTLRAVSLPSKAGVAFELFQACKIYFPYSIKNRDFRMVFLCSGPFLLMKLIGMPAWIKKKLIFAKK